MGARPSERVVIQSPTSFTGSAKRIWNMTRGKAGAVKVALGTFAVILIMLVWCLVLMWYMVWGIFLVPWRLFRRGSRKRKRDELRHREMLRAIERRQ